jgi:Protein of unknown function (DUF2804)
MARTREAALSRLPWRGPGEGRPDLPLPPGRMPLRIAGATRKQWRYLAAFCEEFMLCAARIQVGPLGQTFWAVVDRERGQIHENTRLRLPGMRGEVWREEDTDHVMAGEGVRLRLRCGKGSWVESVSPTGAGAYVWTRKRCDVPIQCDVRVGERRWKLEARGIEDESAGYHPRHTVWTWSAGVGRTVDDRSVGWNLVAGINDPPRDSERAIWLDGHPSEPGPATFEGLDAIAFEDGSRLEFTAEQERHRKENLLLARYEYRQPFGRFTGSLPGGIELERALGVIEHHDAVW